MSCCTMTQHRRTPYPILAELYYPVCIAGPTHVPNVQLRPVHQSKERGVLKTRFLLFYIFDLSPERVQARDCRAVECGRGVVVGCKVE